MPVPILAPLLLAAGWPALATPSSGALEVEPCLGPIPVVQIQAADIPLRDEIMVCGESVETVVQWVDEADETWRSEPFSAWRIAEGVDIWFPADAAGGARLRLGAQGAPREASRRVAGQTLRFRLEARPRPEDPLLWPLRFRVEGRPVAEVVAAIAETIGQRLEGADRLCEAPVNLHFERNPPPVRGVLLLLAKECGVGLEFPGDGWIRIVPASTAE